MVWEGRQKFGEKIEEIRCARGTGAGDLVAKSQYEMRYDTQVILFSLQNCSLLVFVKFKVLLWILLSPFTALRLASDLP